MKNTRIPYFLINIIKNHIYISKDKGWVAQLFKNIMKYKKNKNSLEEQKY